MCTKWFYQKKHLCAQIHCIKLKERFVCTKHLSKERFVYTKHLSKERFVGTKCLSKDRSVCTKCLSKERFVCTKHLSKEKSMCAECLSKGRRYVHKIDSMKRKILAQKYTVSKDRKCVHKYTTLSSWKYYCFMMCHIDENRAARGRRCLQLYRHANNFWSECTSVF